MQLVNVKLNMRGKIKILIKETQPTYETISKLSQVKIASFNQFQYFLK